VKANRMEINKALAAQAAGAFLLATLLALLPAPIASQGDSATVQVVRVIDGDTIEVCCVFGDRVKVRYIGVDTHEIHHPMKGMGLFPMVQARHGLVREHTSKEGMQ